MASSSTERNSHKEYLSPPNTRVSTGQTGGTADLHGKPLHAFGGVVPPECGEICRPRLSSPAAAPFERDARTANRPVVVRRRPPAHRPPATRESIRHDDA